MYEGNKPQQSVDSLYEFGILQLLYKLPDESKELQDKVLVDQLINQGVKFCEHLGVLFESLKSEVE
jgi:hypothetical protein